MTLKEFQMWLDGYIAGGGTNTEEVRAQVEKLEKMTTIKFVPDVIVKKKFIRRIESEFPNLRR